MSDSDSDSELASNSDTSFDNYYSHDFDDNTADTEIYNNIDFEEFIYQNSHLNVNEFSKLFLWICQKLHISRNNRDVLLDFIRNLLPSDNKIPSSYYQIIKMNNFTKPKPKVICPQCSVSLDSLKQQHIVHKHQIIVFPVLPLKLLNLMLLNKKSSKSSFWAMISCICELPPIVRYSYMNMIMHFFISYSKPNLNNFLEKHMKDFESLLKNGLIIDAIGKLKVKIIGLVCDTPARSKILNTIQFNGKYGCINIESF